MLVLKKRARFDISIGEGSKWATPYKTIEQTLQKYPQYIARKMQEDSNKYNIFELDGRRLGCDRESDMAHGKILEDILHSEKSKYRIGKEWF